MRVWITTMFVLLLLAGCAGKEPLVYPVRGQYVMPAFNGAAAIIDHEEITGYMAAMRMTFRVDDPSARYKLQPGVKIAFDLVVTADGHYITDLKALPDSTVLNLAPRNP